MNIEKLKKANDQQQHALREVERRGFLLKTLCDATRELSGHEDTEKMMEIFLLTSMGTLGVTQGFVFLLDTESVKGQVTSRGVEDGDIKRLRESIPQIIQRYFSETLQKEAPLPMEAELIAKDGLPDNSFCPPETKVLIQWNIDEKYSGLMGLGARILTEAYSDEDIEFLLSLTNGLLISIKNAQSTAIIRQLNVELQQKNIEQEEALKEAEHTQKELDSRVFHLNALYDTTRELSGLTDTKRIMETFLLMTMGTFSIEQGYILLLDSKEKTAVVAYRGIEKGRLRTPHEDDIEGIIIKFLEKTKNKGLTPMHAQMVPPEKLLDNPVCPMEASIGLLFIIDEKCLGLMGLGSKITRQGYSEEEQEVLLTLINNFMVFLGNTRSFETIQKLNVDLEKRNIQLKKTIEELSASRLRIEVLERAKARVKSVIQREMERTRRVSVMDFILILAVALGLGIISNLSNPEGINLVPKVWSHKPSPKIDVHVAKLNYDAGTSLFVDARPYDFFKQRHIHGAVNLPVALFDYVYMMKFSNLDPKQGIIIYGRNISRLYDEEVAFKLASRGHVNVKVLSGGLSAWQEKGYPLDP